MVAIETAFPNPQTRLCCWHMMQALTSKINEKNKIQRISFSGNHSEQAAVAQISRPSKSAKDDFVKLIHSQSVAEFGEIWAPYQSTSMYHEWTRILAEISPGNVAETRGGMVTRQL
ncbi:hypothetical protein K3495_g13636 [Podosphaera aphanis]|nr:hypothetical protein K3495_g13636 [Podosphaera aphanis]